MILNISLLLDCKETMRNPVVGVHIKNHLNEQIAHIINLDDKFYVGSITKDEKVQIRVKVPRLFFVSIGILHRALGRGRYEFCLRLHQRLYGLIEVVQGNALKRLTPYP